ncbi:adenylate/guanylate cyclase domain-containing protein [Stappia indica]|uniref:adenylate/guanylate cyclase domain-containing protein n=1 Tax=Stappia indica TaxID=538381 RepID=UPI001CD62B18|nr:adenylate/guanylate cyclase domain-containing protein [Stappia indica]MCA1298341.1 adenylate/guanylate cyclase domain-containing protein [Stappia indica]
MVETRGTTGTASAAAFRQRLRLVSGLTLLTFAFTHFLNHMLGLWSLEAMEAGRELFLAVWRNPLGELLLVTAILTHVALALWKTARRRTWRMPVWQWIQLLLGLAIPYLLIPHVIGTAGLAARFGYADTYRNVLTIFWPGLLVNQTTLMVLVWTHGMIGLHFWLRLSKVYRRWFPWLLSVAVLVPVLASLGWIGAARRLALVEQVPFPLTGEMITWSDPLILILQRGFFGLLALVVAAILVRTIRRRFAETITITYPGGRTLRVVPGPTLLEVSRMNGIAHADVCGGRARCSTCRTRILAGGDSLPPPSTQEAQVLARIGADDTVRLACQIRPTAPLKVQPLVPARGAPRRNVTSGDAYHWGVEQPAAILFVDLRNFTGITESRLSYDVVFLLNRYLGETARAIEACGGYVDKFIGDGVMAIFGMTDGIQSGCRNALAATNAIAENLEHLNVELASQLETPLRIGMGLHAGQVILGRIGAADGGNLGAGTRITALGDVVNIASRLEAASKELGQTLVVSRQVLRIAGYSCDAARETEIEVRGRSRPMTVYAVTPPTPLREALASPTENAAE